MNMDPNDYFKYNKNYTLIIKKNVNKISRSPKLNL